MDRRTRAADRALDQWIFVELKNALDGETLLVHADDLARSFDVDADEVLASVWRLRRQGYVETLEPAYDGFFMIGLNWRRLTYAQFVKLVRAEFMPPERPSGGGPDG